MTRMMKILIASFLLVSASLHPAMAEPSSRSVTVDYGGEPSTIVIEFGDFGAHFFLATSDDVPTEKDERFVSLEIADGSGDPVVGAVHQGRAELGFYCGDGAERFPLVNRKAVHVHLQTGVSTECGAGSAPSEGTITFTFHK